MHAYVSRIIHVGCKFHRQKAHHLPLVVRELDVAIIILQRLSTSRILRDHEALDDSVH